MRWNLRFVEYLSVLTVFCATILVANHAEARNVRSDYSGFSGVAPGVFELGLENVFLYRGRTVDNPQNEVSTSSRDFSYIGGVAPRYFLMQNLSVGLSLNYFRTSRFVEITTNDSVDSSRFVDEGFLGFATANYAVRLGNSMFFDPGIGLGGFVGSRVRPGEQSGQAQTSDLNGLAGRLDLGFAFFTSSNFSLKAGLDVIYRAGSESVPDSDQDKTNFNRVDSGFNIGFGYSF